MNRIDHMLPADGRQFVKQCADNFIADIPASWKPTITAIHQNDPKKLLDKMIENLRFGIEWSIKNDADGDAACIYREQYLHAVELRELLYGK